MSTGRLIANEVPVPTQPTPAAQTGSAIQASAGVLEEKNEVLADAVKNLGGGSRRRRRRHRRMRGGAETVEVPKVPNLVSAGGVDAKGSYAGLLELKHAAVADGAYDGLGNAPAMNVNKAGGRRKRSRNRNNGKRSRRSKRSTLLRSRRTRRGTRRVRHSRH